VVIAVFALFTLAGALIALTNWRPKRKVESKRAEVIVGVIAGSFLGLVVGFAGRGGGAMVVPVLLLSGLEPREAAATSSLIVTCSALSGFIGHLPKARFHPSVTVGTLLAVLLGSQLGSRFMASRIRPKGVRYLFGGLLLLVAVLFLKEVL